MITNRLLVLALLALLLPALAAGAPDEAMGRVSKVVDGDTFDVQLQSHDSRITEDLIRIRLADIDCPETRGSKACEAGKKASAVAEKLDQHQSVVVLFQDSH